MSRYLFVLSHGPQNPEPVGQCLRLARLSVHKGHDVDLFLMGEAVGLIPRSTPCNVWGRPARSDDDPCRLFSCLCQSKARILVDKRSARERFGQSEALPERLTLSSDAAMLDLAEEAKFFMF